MKHFFPGRFWAALALQRAWLGRNWLARLLWPLSRLYGLAAAVRRKLYQLGLLSTAQADVPVLVVGNVVAGGAGKTPMVIALVHHFQDQGVRVGVLSRGYGRAPGPCQEVLEQTPVSESGDEAALIHRATGAPVFVASRRIDAARALLAAHPGTALLICDDGLQHYALGRDIEIAVFDDRGLGNGWLIPAGPLREPWPERLQCGIDLVIHSGQKPAFGGYRATRRLADYAVAADGSLVELDSLRSGPLFALAAIANPKAFFSMLRSRGLRLERTISLPDHDDFATLNLVLPEGSTVLCTEKDAIKLFSRPPTSSYRMLAVPLEFIPERAFLRALDALAAPLLPVLSQLPSKHGH